MEVIAFVRKVSRRGTTAALATAALLALGLAAAWAQAAQPTQGQQQPAPGQQPQQQQQQGQQEQQQGPGLSFSTDAGIVFNVIKADKTADFEMIVGRLKDALAKSEDPVRKQQAAGWKVFKAQEPAQNGNVYYLFVLDPVVKDADYTISKILSEAFPSEVQDLYAKMRDAYVPGGFKLSLTQIAALGH
jgi:hypothetical protein